jgi:hypothetical protein
MSTTTPRRLAALLAALALLLAFLLGAAPEARAAPDASPSTAAAPAPLLAEGGWNIGSLFIGITQNRTRIIQFCAVIMCLALYILMRKLTPDAGAEPRKRP